MRYYILADTHGFFTPMIEALRKAGYFDDSGPHKLVILGDLFDRGKEAVKLQEFVNKLVEADKVILIRGNHEDLYERFVTEDNGRPYSIHLSNGTYDTALQLTGYDRVMAQIKHYDFAEAAQKTPFYKTIMPAMRDYFETEHYVFVHGWIPCARDSRRYEPVLNWRDATKEMWDRARWYNGMDAAQNNAENKTIICGHWHASYGHAVYEKKGHEFGPDADFSPYYGPGIIAIDACTAYTGFVNCLVIDD